MKYVSIELGKINMKQQLISLAACNFLITALVIMMKFLIPDQISGLDSGMPTIELSTTIIIDTLIKAVFIVWQAVLIASLIVSEFQNKTALMLYTYPIKMTKIIISKLVVVFIITFIFMSISGIFQNVVMYVLNQNLPMFSYNITTEIILTVLITNISAIFMGLITFAVGMLNRSTIATIVAAILIMCIVTSAAAGPGGIISKLSVAVTLGLIGLMAGLFTVWKIETEDYC
ncbi:ABC transporter permease [Lysinibacillus sp. NPDC093692]|uniref:ABC transporter permease n=1 Tax=Lysinibacillus sp. NPDC093692 TaxID=3390578 RepID=UPI003D04C53E